jgi:hypothetical protein
MWHPNFTVAAAAVMSPPIRDKSHGEALKQALAGVCGELGHKGGVCGMPGYASMFAHRCACCCCTLSVISHTYSSVFEYHMLWVAVMPFGCGVETWLLTLFSLQVEASCHTVRPLVSACACKHLLSPPPPPPPFPPPPCIRWCVAAGGNGPCRVQQHAKGSGAA